MTVDPDRRYSEDEVARILEDASVAEAEGRTRAGGEPGMSISELYDIAEEVGISRELVTRAAAQLDAPEPAVSPERRFLGTTIGVGRTVQLPRPLTEGEWERLVIDLRDTFDARGRIVQEGSFRQWYNGNLQALLEPTGSGTRLRLSTIKGNSVGMLGAGALMLAAAPFALLAGAVSGAGLRGLMLPIMLGALGAVMYGSSKISLPAWANTRQRQMDAIAARLIASMEATDRAAEDEDVLPGPGRAETSRRIAGGPD